MSTSSTLSERFKRLPEEQALRNEESARQAREASELLKRLRNTRVEAENAVKEEIMKTRQIQREEIDQHPDIADLKRRLRQAEREKDNWQHKQREYDTKIKDELRALKRDEDKLIDRLESVEQEDQNAMDEYERIQKERAEREKRVEEIECELDDLKRIDETPFLNDIHVLRNQISELERKLPSDISSINENLEIFQKELNSLRDERDKVVEERAEYTKREAQAGLDLIKAQDMAKKSRDFERERREELEKINKIDWTREYEEQQQELKKAEANYHSIETMRDNLRNKLQERKKDIGNEDRLISELKAQIKKLTEEVAKIEHSKNENEDSLKDLENEVERYNALLKDSEEQLVGISDQKEAMFEVKRRNTENADRIGREIEDLQKTRQEADAEETKAGRLCEMIEIKCAELDRLIKTRNDQIHEYEGKIRDLKNEKFDSEDVTAEINAKRDSLNNVLTELNEWRKTRFDPVSDELDRLRNWLNKHKVMPVPPRRSDSIQKDLDKVVDRINDLELKQKYSKPDFEDPDVIRAQIKVKEAEIRSMIAKRPDSASPRFNRQFEKEAEAIMRLETACALERKQVAIERDASELSHFRVSKNPRIALDDEAKAKLWSVNRDEVETDVITDQVLKLCYSHNISVKE